MEASSIPNLGSSPQAPHSAADTSSPEKSANSGGLPSFAQVVREILVRTTTQNDTQPAHTSHSSNSAAAGGQVTLSTVSPQTWTPTPLPADHSALHLASLMNQSALAPPASTSCQNESAVASTNSSESPRASSQVVVPPAPPTALTQPSLGLPLPSLTIQSSPNQLAAPSFSGTSAALSDKSIVSADQAQLRPNGQPGDLSWRCRAVVDLQILSGTPAVSIGVPISSLQPQITQLQPTYPTNGATNLVSIFTASHPVMSQINTKSAFASIPLFAPLPATLALPLSNALSATLVPASHQPIVLPANSPSSNHSGSQDSSPNPGAQKSSDLSATSIPAVSREGSSFSQALAAANDAKPEAAPPAANQAPVISPVSILSSDRPTATAAASSPAAPANPPQPPFHTLDAAANRIVSDAQLLQNTGHSEMRIAMQTDKFGAVELHTRVVGDEIGAAITVEKRDAHAALAVELPALQQALSEKQLRVDLIALLHGPLQSTTGDHGAQSQAQQGDRGHHRAQAGQSFLRDSRGEFYFSPSAIETRGIFDSQGRLSVQA
jgi:hypothetical protein